MFPIYVSKLTTTLFLNIYWSEVIQNNFKSVFFSY